MAAPNTRRKNKLTAAIAIGVVAGMVGLAFAMVPIYRVVCRGLGIGGTTQRAEHAPSTISDVDVTVRFDANTDPQLPWEFKPNQRSVTLKLGETKTITYHVHNLSKETITGSAEFNVTPEKIGQYFNKLACFCFQEQTLKPGQEADLGVTFFVDPALIADSNTEEVRTITLSYTFFRSKDGLPVESAPVAKTAANASATQTK